MVGSPARAILKWEEVLAGSEGRGEGCAWAGRVEEGVAWDGCREDVG